MERSVVDRCVVVEGLQHVLLEGQHVAQLQDQACSVCLSGFSEGAIVSKTHCSHVFHYVCLMPSLKRGRSTLHRFPVSKLPSANPEQSSRKARLGRPCSRFTAGTSKRANAPCQSTRVEAHSLDKGRPEAIECSKAWTSRVGIRHARSVSVWWSTWLEEERQPRRISSNPFTCNVEPDKPDHKFVPPAKSVTLPFLKAILCGEKQLLPMSQVKPVGGVERFPELTLQKLIDFARENLPELFSYLPEPVEPHRLDRNFVLTLINSLNPGSINTMRIEALQRSRSGQSANTEQTIQLAAEYRNLLHSSLFPLSSL